MKQLMRDMSVAVGRTRCAKCRNFDALLTELNCRKQGFRSPELLSKEKARDAYFAAVISICSSKAGCKEFNRLVTDATLIFFRNYLQRVEKPTVNRMPSPVLRVEPPKGPTGYFSTGESIRTALRTIKFSLSGEALRVLRVFDLDILDRDAQAMLLSICDSGNTTLLVTLQKQVSFLVEKDIYKELFELATKLSKMFGAAHALNHNQSASTAPQVDAIITLLEFYRDKTKPYWRTSLKPLPPVIDDEQLHGKFLGRLVEIEIAILASGKTLADVLSPGEQFLHTYLQKASPSELVARLRAENPSLFGLKLQ